jgi:hypothetical protein
MALAEEAVGPAGGGWTMGAGHDGGYGNIFIPCLGMILTQGISRRTPPGTMGRP